ncbi:MAG: YafY family protein [Actinomycetota bacterium]|nr:YafY family protein [Actinomycetota bacterium]
MADVTRRMLSLLSTLQAGRSSTASELAERLGVSERTVRRDVDRLRGYGYEVRSQPGPGGSYRLVAGRSMAPLVLDDDEAVAAMLGLAVLAAASSGDADTVDDAAGRAYGKLDQLLPSRLRGRVDALRASVEAERSAAPAIASATVADLAGAAAARQVVRFDYRDRAGVASERRVEPHRLVHRLMRWYLLGWDLGRGDWRVFRIDRVVGATPTTAVFEPRSLPAASAAEYLRVGMRGEHTLVRLVVRAPVATVADAFTHHDVDLRRVDDGTTAVEVAVDSWEWLLPQLARLGVELTDLVVVGDDARRTFGAFAGRLAAAIG